LFNCLSTLEDTKYHTNLHNGVLSKEYQRFVTSQLPCVCALKVYQRKGTLIKRIYKGIVCFNTLIKCMLYNINRTYVCHKVKYKVRANVCRYFEYKYVWKIPNTNCCKNPM